MSIDSIREELMREFPPGALVAVNAPLEFISLSGQKSGAITRYAEDTPIIIVGYDRVYVPAGKNNRYSLNVLCLINDTQSVSGRVFNSAIEMVKCFKKISDIRSCE